MLETKGRIGLHILTRNRPEYLYGLLITLWRQTIQNWDIVIVDNSDTWCEEYPYISSMISRIRLEGHRVLVYRNEDEALRTNIGGSRNKAIELDDCEFCCRIDDDSILEPDWLERQYKILTEGVGEVKPENIAASGGLVPYMHVQYYRKATDPFNEIYKDQEGIWQFSDDGHFRFKGPKILESHHLRSSFMFRKDVAVEIGMHGTEYGSTGFREETDFCLKMINAGYKLFTDVDCLAWHMYAWGEKSREDKGQEKMKKQYDNEILFRKKFDPIFEDLLTRGIFRCK